MDERDRRILRELRCDARQNITTLSRKLNLPTSSVWDRLRRMERRLSLRHTTLLDFAQIGLPLHVRLVISVSQKEHQHLIQYLSACRWVNNLYRVQGSADLLADVLFADMKNLFEYTQELTDRFNIDVSTHHLVEEIKKESFYSSNHPVGEPE